MIVVEDPKPATASDDPGNEQGSSTSHPPTYDQAAREGSSVNAAEVPTHVTTDESDTSMAPQIVLPNIQPSNHLSINRSHESIKGSWIIDPSLRIPPAVLVPLAPDEVERKNLRLECRHGNVNGDIWLLDGEGSIQITGVEKRRKKKATIEVRTQHGNMTIKVRSEKAVPLNLTCAVAHGAANIYLPRSFCGPAKLVVKNTTVTFSNYMAPQITTFSENQGIRHCFIGHYASAGWEGPDSDSWEGDELTVDATWSRVKMYFVDEPQKEQKPGFFAKLFSG